MDNNGGIPDGQYSFFSKKKVLFIIPHPDDEINLAGGLIYWLNKIGATVFYLYTTNGNYRGRGKERVVEVFNSIKTLGGKEDNAIFLGYSDQAADASEHLYMNNKEWADRQGKKTTYLLGGSEYCFKKYGNHHIQNRTNFINDIKEVILDYLPDIIFCVDFDTHVDHRAASLGFEHAMGEILQSCDYRPIVFKSFAYPLAYKGKKDFRIPNIRSTAYNHERLAGEHFANPYFKWDDRVRFALPREVRECFLPKNILFNALRCHRSQSISGRADRIINNDNVAWLRRTDSLLYDAQIEVSSGEASFLNDFMLFDCRNILGGDATNPDYNDGVWIPDAEDSVPVITLSLNGCLSFNKIIFYQNIRSHILRMEIEINGRSVVHSNYTTDSIWEIDLGDQFSTSISIRILSRESFDAGFTEIELYNDKERTTMWILPLDGDDLYYQDVKAHVFFETGSYIFDGVKGKSLIAKDCSATYSLRMKDILSIAIDILLLKTIRIYYALRRMIMKFVRKY